jgi:hypothetical protein
VGGAEEVEEGVDEQARIVFVLMGEAEQELGRIGESKPEDMEMWRAQIREGKSEEVILGGGSKGRFRAEEGALGSEKLVDGGERKKR